MKNIFTIISILFLYLFTTLTLVSAQSNSIERNELPNPSEIKSVDLDFIVITNKELNKREEAILKAYRGTGSEINKISENIYQLYTKDGLLSHQFENKVVTQLNKQMPENESDAKLIREYKTEFNEKNRELFANVKHELEDLYFVVSSGEDQIVGEFTAYSYNDPLRSSQDYLNTLGLESSIDNLNDGARVTVAVLDSGANPYHEDIQGRITYPTSVYEPWKYWDYYDRTGHGTSINGIIAANSNNNIGTVGICDKCLVMPIRVGDYSATLASYASAVSYAVSRGADVISISTSTFIYRTDISYAPQEALQKVINDARAANIPIFMSAGNTGNQIVLASYEKFYDNVYTVGGVSSNLDRDPNSSWGSHVDISARFGTYTHGLGNNQYRTFLGTSASTPIISAVAGLAISNLKEEGKGYTVKGLVEEILQDSVNNFYNHTVNSQRLGTGSITLTKLRNELNAYNSNTSFEAYMWGTNSSGTLKPKASLYIDGSKVTDSFDVPLNTWTNKIWYNLPPITSNTEVAVVYENDQNSDMELKIYRYWITSPSTGFYNSIVLWNNYYTKYDLGTLSESVDNINLQPDSQIVNGQQYMWRSKGILKYNGGLRVKANGGTPTTNW